MALPCRGWTESGIYWEWDGWCSKKWWRRQGKYWWYSDRLRQGTHWVWKCLSRAHPPNPTCSCLTHMRWPQQSALFMARWTSEKCAHASAWSATPSARRNNRIKLCLGGQVYRGVWGSLFSAPTPTPTGCKTPAIPYWNWTGKETRLRGQMSMYETWSGGPRMTRSCGETTLTFRGLCRMNQQCMAHPCWNVRGSDWGWAWLWDGSETKGRISHNTVPLNCVIMLSWWLSKES